MVKAAKKRPATKRAKSENSDSNGHRTRTPRQPVRMTKDLMAKSVKRIHAYVARIRQYALPDAKIAEDGEKAATLLDSVLEGLEEHADFKPPRGTVSTKVFQVGTHVSLRPEQASKYDGMFASNSDLRVIAVTGSKLICETKDKGVTIRTALPRSHVAASAEAAS
jgi:hypothetical protein